MGTASGVVEAAHAGASSETEPQAVIACVPLTSVVEVVAGFRALVCPNAGDPTGTPVTQAIYQTRPW